MFVRSNFGVCTGCCGIFFLPMINNPTLHIKSGVEMSTTRYVSQPNFYQNSYISVSAIDEPFLVLHYILQGLGTIQVLELSLHTFTTMRELCARVIMCMARCSSSQ